MRKEHLSIQQRSLVKRPIDSTDEDGFTVLELIVVVLIIGILVAIAVPTYLGAQNSAYDRSAQSDVVNIVRASASFQLNNNGSYSGMTPSAMVSLEPNYAEKLNRQSSITSSVTAGAIDVMAPSDGMGICAFETSHTGTTFGIAYFIGGSSPGYFYYVGSNDVTCSDSTPPTNSPTTWSAVSFSALTGGSESSNAGELTTTTTQAPDPTVINTDGESSSTTNPSDN